MHSPIPVVHLFSNNQYQWIGFVGKIFTGNHRCSHQKHGFSGIFSQQNQSIDLTMENGQGLELSNSSILMKHGEQIGIWHDLT